MRYRTIRPVTGILACILFLQGCMTFRERPRTVRRYFDANKVDGSVQSYVAHKRRMYYAMAGQEMKPIVIFIHGSPGSFSAFLPYLTDSLLLQRALLITADRPGFGYSGFGYGEPSLDKQGSILKELVLLKKKNQPVILAGHSLAGPLVAKMAVQYPELIQGIAIIAGSIDPDLEPNELWFRAPLATPFLSWILPPAFRASNVELYHLKPQLHQMMSDWEKIRCPVVVIHGQKDQFVPFENVHFAERKITNAPVRYLTDETANHFIPWTKPGIVTDGIHYLLDVVDIRRAIPNQRPATSAPDSVSSELLK